MSSDTGYYPGCKYNFPTEIVLVHVEAELIEEQNFQIPIYGNQSYSSLLPVFRCSFGDISEGNYVYDVDWYINGDIVKHHLNVPFSNINSTVLRDTDWTSQFKMNMELKCTIRMRYSIDSAPGSLLYSQPYKAGIFPAKYEYTVNEGESIDITFTSTAPVGCIPSHDAVKTNCEQNFYIFQQMADQTSVSRNSNIVKADIVFEAQFCGLSIKSLNWENETILRVHGLSDSIYNFHDRSTILKISTLAVSESNYIWRDVQVPDIMVTVIDKDYVLIDRQCMSYNDPHITTFDGRLYHYMNVGEFVMYKNDKGPYSVHALFTNCGFGWAGSSCHCGIAVRSRDSLFVLRTCQTISRTEKHLLPEPITKLLRCHDKDLVIEHNRNSYKITLPIGTEINFTISRRSKFISMIAIKPSICDINRARGLCGVPSTTKDQSDDFTHRQNGPINNDQEFADSWRINPTMIAEQLFCVDNVQCNLTDITEFCSETLMPEEETMASFSTACSSSQGKNRSVNYVDKIVQRTFSGDDDVIDIPCFTYDESVFSTEVTIPETFRNGWTENTAWQTCMDEIQNALPPEVANLVDVSVAKFVESCVLDIKLVGDTTFLPDTIGTMLTFVMTEIRRNESLYLLNTTEGSQTLVEYVTSFLCPNNCSENGNCAMGLCECNGKYIGDDCSESITIPPSNISLTSNGLCIPGTNDCRNPNIFGNFLTKTIWYNIKYFQKVTNSIKYISKSDVLQANFSNMFMVSVDLMSSKGKIATTETIVAEGYEISLSYDGTNFGESVSIIIHDENCYSCHSTTIACFEQDLCSPTVIPSAKNDNNESIVVIAASIGGLLLVIMVIIGLIYYKVRSNSTRAKINATADKLEERPNLYLDQSNGNQVWMTRDQTISDLQLVIDENRGDSPFEMFEKPLHFVPPPSHYKRMPENFKWQ
ncbi:uncharacterized protein LOC143064464 [Mytilus galloprovincialis]|uniref:uncharacterized protein LOC143064464 n=1 Tax=Mytilus galloprovincialis TaxID=29158 RepID=UPI003F7CA50F